MDILLHIAAAVVLIGFPIVYYILYRFANRLTNRFLALLDRRINPDK